MTTDVQSHCVVSL